MTSRYRDSNMTWIVSLNYVFLFLRILWKRRDYYGRLELKDIDDMSIQTWGHI